MNVYKCPFCEGNGYVEMKSVTILFDEENDLGFDLSEE